MGPIRPENRRLYPANWIAISNRIRFDRSGGRCECRGECGKKHDGLSADVEGQTSAYDRCTAWHNSPSPESGARVVLTVAHLDHDPTNCADSNLRAFCQGCHNRYDAAHRAANRNRTSHAKQERSAASTDGCSVPRQDAREGTEEGRV